MKISTILVTLLGLASPFASADQTIEVNGRTLSLKPAIEYYSKVVRTIDKPVTMWSYFSQRTASAFGDPANDPAAARAYMHAVSSSYWQDLCSHDTKLDPQDCDQSHKIDNMNLYGSGLYLARDPVITVNYGRGTGWHVIQIQFPAGFRYLDLRQDGHRQDLPAEVEKLYRDIGCPTPYGKTGYDLSWLMSFANPNFGSNRVCDLALRKIFKDSLAIDGFFYPYLATAFKTCTVPTKDSSISGEAFVLANDSKIKNFSVFNSQSTKQPEDRLRIQSFFYKASAEDFHTNFDRYLRSYNFADHPGYILPKYTQLYNCMEGAGCIWDGLTLKGPKDDNDFIIDVPYPATPTFPLPAKISSANIPYSQGASLTDMLMWKDLDGSPIDGHLDGWMKDNFFKCE